MARSPISVETARWSATPRQRTGNLRNQPRRRKTAQEHRAIALPRHAGIQNRYQPPIGLPAVTGSSGGANGILSMMTKTMSRMAIPLFLRDFRPNASNRLNRPPRLGKDPFHACKSDGFVQERALFCLGRPGRNVGCVHPGDERKSRDEIRMALAKPGM